MSEKLLVSIITVSFNSAETIKDTINSVINQNYRPIEYVFVDGQSNDDTLMIIKSFIPTFMEHNIRIKIISEKDDGLYDAMNKGIKISEGGIICILNSDDFYTHNAVISKVVDKMSMSDCVISNLKYVNRYNVNKVERVWKTKVGKFIFGWNPPHPSTFFTREVYLKYGLYRTDLRISSDYDFLFRTIHINKIRVSYLNDYVVSMRNGGESTKNIRSNLVGNMEIYDILKIHKQRFKIFIITARFLNKAFQFKIKK
ncbi:MAG: glycosyltransferase family 2 protein [Acholeplasmataceae bacterium]|nr:glycosyltransferase family 2 protein [Acholeplasmataceae bacterium]